jgi:hypothetical protein
MINNDNNIFFLFEEKTDTLTNKNNNGQENAQKILQDLEFDFKIIQDQPLQKDNIDFSNTYESNNNDNFNRHLSYFYDKEFYGDNELYYNQEYTIKDLLKICEFYGIDKYIKMSKCKKRDIIETIVYFENLPENEEIVQKRNIMWAYITELMNEPKMKKYVIWN